MPHAAATWLPTGPNTVQPSRLKRWLASGLAILLVAMPFHAFLSVSLGHVFGHEAIIESWKEVLTVCLAVGAMILLVRSSKVRPWFFNRVIWSASSFIVISLIVTAFIHPRLIAVIYGMKTDLEPIILLMIAVLIPLQTRRISNIIIWTGLIVAVIGLLLGLVLPPNFLVHFGYGPSTIQPYLLVDPSLHTIRTPGTLGGPNQLGAYLVIPFCLIIARLRREPRLWQIPAALIIIWAIIITYSRSALIAAVIGSIIIILTSLRRRVAVIAAISILIVGSGVGALLAASAHGGSFEYYVLHAAVNSHNAPSSTSQHLAAIKTGLRISLKHPLGEGLGSAGPASFQTSHPIISEDYYLQILIETGVIGLISFLLFMSVLGIELFRRRRDTYALGLAGALAGLSVANLFLHVWADSTTAMVFFIAAGLALTNLKIEQQL